MYTYNVCCACVCNTCVCVHIYMEREPNRNYLGHDGPSQADAGESRVLGERVDLDGAGARARDLIDGLGHVL